MTNPYKGRPTYCNPLSIPEIPRGVEGWMTFTGEPVKSYRSISDPTVFYENGKWYLYPSYGIAWVSEDFASWKHVECTAYDPPGYSPAVAHIGDKYYMFVHSRGLYSGDSPTGPFSYEGPIRYPDGRETSGADHALFADDDGRVYLYWHGSRVHPVRGVSTTLTLGAEVDPKQPNVLLQDPVICNEFDPDHVWERFGQYNQDEEFGWVEGAHMLKHNGRYYLVYAGCGTQFASYCMAAYYSDVSPLGPFVCQKNNPITLNRTGVIKGAGHGCIEHGPDNSLWAFYTTAVAHTHCFERRIGMDWIGVNEDGELYCPRITDTPQYAPGAVADPEKDGDTGLLPLTFFQRSRHRASSMSEGRESFYALDENLTTFWKPAQDDPSPTLLVGLSAEYDISASRLIWEECGLDYDNGVVPGPIRYKIECAQDAEGPWELLLDRTDSDEEYVIDYRTFETKSARFVRLTVTGWPEGITPGVVSFVVFGRRSKIGSSEG